MKHYKTLSLSVWLTMTAGTALAGGGTARVQVIHNCADAAAASVDVWLDNTLLLNDFAFRTASPFVDAPAGVDFTVGIAPSNSTMASDAIFQQQFTLNAGSTYVIVASGIVSPVGYTPNPGFSLAVFDQGQEAATVPANTDVLVYHGSTDAPTVDVYESAVLNATAVDNAAYGDYAGYLELPTADYVLQVRDAAQTTVVATYSAPLATLGLSGTALTVLASGFLDPANNSNGPAFGLFAALPAGGPLVPLPLLPNPTARVQVIHNSADQAASTVDVYLNDVLLLDDFAFRTASPFVDAPATIDIHVGIAPANSTSSADAIANFTYNLASGGSYIITASGIVSGTGYQPATPFNLYVAPNAREASAAPGNTDVLVFHGSTDAPTVDVYESAVLNATAVDNAAYGDYAGYLELPTADYVLQVRDAAQTTVVATYSAPLATLGLSGTALTVVASGFLDPTNNSNGPAFGLFAALPSGGPLVPLPLLPNPTARVQVIHNSADLAASTVDVYLNDVLLLDDFAFRTASPFVDAPATIDIHVGIAPANSTSSADAIANFTYNLADAGRYIITANGIVSGTGYTPAVPFDLLVKADARETAALPGNTDVLVFHGCTDAPTVDVGETAVLGGATIVDDLAYGGYDGYLEVPTNDYVLQVRAADGTPLVSYQAPLSTLGLQGAAITVLASGFLDPTMNSNGPGFGLWVALASGGPLVELPIATGLVSESEPVANVSLAPNPAVDLTFLQFSSKEDIRVTIEVVDMTGRAVKTVTDARSLKGTNRLELPTADLTEGLYQVLVRSSNGMIQLPLVVVR